MPEREFTCAQGEQHLGQHHGHGHCVTLFELKTVTCDRRIGYRIQFHNGEGMRKSLDSIVLPALLSLRLMAQDNPNVDVSGGCRYTHLAIVVYLLANANGRDTFLIVKINKPHLNSMASPGSALSCTELCPPKPRPGMDFSRHSAH